MSCLKISLLSTPSSSADCKEEEQPSTEGKEKKRKKISTVRKNKRRKEDKNVNRTLKVKLYLNLAQKRLLKRWMGLVRLIYNTIIDYLQSRRFLIVCIDKNGNKCKKTIKFPKIQFLRRIAYLKLRSKKAYDDIPNNIIDETVDEAVKNFNSKDSKTRLKFKTRKDLNHTITIRAQNFSKKYWNQFYISSLFNNSMRTPRKKPYDLMEESRDLRALHFETKRKNNSWPSEKINNDCKLTYFRKTNEWILSWVHERQKKSKETHERFVAIDPGVRTPFVMYSPTKGITEIGKNDAQRLMRLCLHADKLSSVRDKLKSSTSKRKKKKAERIDKAISRIFKRIKNLRNELHKKTVNYLVKNYDVVIIPEFNVSNMVRREKRKINSKTVRSMLTWSHYSFRQRLKHKAEEIGTKMIIQNESYTSKTCSACGNIQNIGGRKVYKCRRCKVVIDRDVNGARGIFLRALLDGAICMHM